METKKKRKSVGHSNQIDWFCVQAQKSEKYAARLTLAIERGIAPTKQAYILKALKAQFERDGITL